jgi:hypothetical protein
VLSIGFGMPAAVGPRCRVDPSRLTTAFTVLLIAVAGYSLARSLPGLV